MKLNFKQKFKRIFILALFLALCFNFSTTAQGSTSYQLNREIKSLNQDIKSNKDKLNDIEAKKEEYARKIREKQNEKASLENQLAILENRIAKTEIEIEALETEINKVNLEIKKVDIEIKNKEDEIDNEKKKIGQALKMLYKEGSASTLEILLLNDSLTDFLNKTRYLEDLNEEMASSLRRLKQYKRDLEMEERSLNDKNEELLVLKDDLKNTKESLEEEKDNKSFLLDATQNSESEYQVLLSEAKREQEQAAAEIATLERRVRAKMSQMDGKKLELNDDGLIWPVPNRGITSYFHDPEYPFRYLFEHPAIDVRAGQGSTLKAAASGYVAKVKIKGTSYGYIMLIHGDGLSTVYGHVSKSYVQEEDYVVQGQTIGLTGGMPGTPGAGNLSTGPHLHFEVRKDGIPVNPLEYLP
ncbi:peptidoglycan DD-metalloendopeptidase family protein [Candidatus Falkowbacteria bacterium]|nr:peptidoglycan DD-metalloendopeptidase family protein [Candidatus Falkowbacteria bacterium]